MFKRFFSTDLALVPDGVSTKQDRELGPLRKAFSDWRFGNDVAAIVAALDRLPNHRLHKIGLHREGLVDAVCDMMLSAEKDRAIGREVIAILDASAARNRSGGDTAPSGEYPNPTGTAAENR
jgi:hypothetical protein